MKKDQGDYKTLSFVKRWIKSFNRIFQLFGKRGISNNAEFVDAILANEQIMANTQEKLETLAEKRTLLEELCEEVDIYYEKKSESDRADNLDEWFDDQVKMFVYDTIPDADQEDVKEIEKSILKSMDKEIEIRAALLESEFSNEESGSNNVSLENEKSDE